MSINRLAISITFMLKQSYHKNGLDLLLHHLGDTLIDPDSDI